MSFYIRVCWIATLFASSTSGGDWPMWRCDAQRSAATSDSLPDDLRLAWSVKIGSPPRAWDDPLNLDLLAYDQVLEPIVVDGRLFVAFNDRDKLVAYDTANGSELWSFYTDAPIRLPPVGYEGRVYFCSDDGFLYCVDAKNGSLVWKFDGAPSRQQAIGNRRLVSAWCARGGPVIRDGTVYFTNSIWPFMGTFIHALDADTGEVRWVNDSTGASYIQQPHSAPSFAGVAPQGALVATDKLLIVPGGRSVPAVFDRADGKLRYFEINAGGKGTGGSFVAADKEHFFVHTRQKGTRAFNLETGLKTAFMPNEPVLANGLIYSAESDDDRAVVRCYGSDHKQRWQINADGSGDLILVGNELVAAGANSITFIRLPQGDDVARVTRTLSVSEPVGRLLAADEKLFAVTMSGSILAFAQQPSLSIPVTIESLAQTIDCPDAMKQSTKKLLEAGQAEGYAFYFGPADSPQAASLAVLSPFVQLVIVDTDPGRVERMRRVLDASGLYGHVTVHHNDASSFMPPKYVANMIFVDHPDVRQSPTSIAKHYESVRPYGGVMHVLTGDMQWESRISALNLERATIEPIEQGVLVRRVGALEGSGDWTHQYGDVANTIKSDDSRVKLPLGVLWFGGSSNTDVLPRHGHGPPEQVIGGRLFIQGINLLSARDVYTGRVLWKREFEDLGTFDVFFDKTYEDLPLDPKYNQVHIPGANARGTNFVATEDRVYIVEGNACHALDPATGKTVGKFELPGDDANQQENWGYIGVYKNVLIGGVGFAMYRDRNSLKFDADNKLSSSKAGFGSKSLDRAASMGLVGFDRHTGKKLWQIDANSSFWHNGIVAGGGKIFCLDKHPQLVEDALRRRGRLDTTEYRILAIDYLSGKTEWQISENVFGTWLGYSEEHGLLLQAGASASDRLSTEVAKGMSVHFGANGTVKWNNESLAYTGPCILHNDWIITGANANKDSAGAFALQDGSAKLVANPLTGKLEPWRMTRTHGCNSVIASENLLTFRSGAAGFYDLLTDSGTGNLGGFKSGCTSNLVVANGVLNAPDYTRTCSCAYQNQTSLALIHMPDVEMWSVSNLSNSSIDNGPIERLAVNFGAPGDRRDSDASLWLEYPSVAGASPPLSIEVNDEATYFQHHSTTIGDVDKSWVLSSGVEGITELKIRLTPPGNPQNYDLRLLFGSPSPLSGVRAFNVVVQGASESGKVTLDPSGKLGNFAELRIDKVHVDGELRLQFNPLQGAAILSGIEIRKRETIP